MEIEVIYSIEGLLLHKGSWESILKEMNNDIMFLELDWIISWWKFFGLKHKLFVLIAVNDQAVAGICPLMITSKSGYNEIAFIGGRESSSMDFILRDNYREEAVGCIFNFLRGMKGKNIINLHGISRKALNYELIKKYLVINKVQLISSSKIFYFLNLKENAFDTHFEHRFGTKTRQTMASKEKKLKRLGTLAYKRVSPDEIDEVFKIHEKRWLRKIGNSSFSKGKTKEFYKELALYKNMKFDINVDVITLNNKVISFMYGFEYNKKYLFRRIAHDDDFYFLSPGELIFKKKIEECFLSQMSVFDFGAGYEPYKAAWTDDYEELYAMVMPVDNLQSLVIFFIKYWTILKLAETLRKNRRITSLKKHFLGRLKFLISKDRISNEILGIKRAVNQYGLLEFIKKNLVDKTGKIFRYKEYLILEREVSSAQSLKSDLRVEEAAIDDLDELSEMMNEAASKVVRRFTNKHKCYTAVYKDEIIFCCWVDCSGIKVSGLELSIPFGKSDSHIYDTYMEKKYKNEDNYTYIFLSIFNLLYKQNFRRCYITIKSSKSNENEILKKIFNPIYKILEKKVFNTIKHSIVDTTSFQKRNGSNED